ncbi:MAG: TonB-dependent receptor [Gemmatimonadetes bacterium]|nr:TonB-dependent receptor [Gemmatimonadota bacterium]
MKAMKVLCAILATAVSCLLLPSEARAATVSGKVLNEAGEPMPAVTVVLPALEIGAFTDERGVFRLESVPQGKHAIEFRFVGYRTIRSEILVTENRFPVLEVTMEPEALIGEEVTVTGDRDLAGELTGSSQSILVLPSSALEERRGQTLGETLESLPGVTSLTTGPAISKPVVRGVHSARVLILNAGVTQEGQQWGGDHAPEIDPFAPARIEVLKGAASVQYGAGAIGGVIRIEPPELPVDPGMGGRFNTNLFSNNRQGAASLLVQGALRRSVGLKWRVQGSLRRAGDARAPLHVIRNSGFDERNYSVALGLTTDRVDTEAYFSHFGTWLGIYKGAHIGNTTDLRRAIERGEPGIAGSFTYEIGNPRQRVDHDLLSVRSTVRFERLGNLELRYGQQYNRREEWDAHARGGRTPTRPGFDLGLQTHSGEVIFHHRNFGNWYGKVGVSGMRQRNARFSTGFLIPDFQAYSLGVFALESWTKGKTTIETGLRYDYRWTEIYSNAGRRATEIVEGGIYTYRNMTGVLGLIHEMTPALAVAANVGRAWRPPGVNELYSHGVHHGTAQFEIGDKELDTESNLNTDLTLRYRGDRGRGELGFFRSSYRNFISLLPAGDLVLTIRGAFPKFNYVQSDAVIQGFDGYLEYDTTRYMGAYLSASLVRGRNTAENEPLYQMPPTRLIAGLNFRLPAAGRLLEAGIGFEGRFVLRQEDFPEGIDYADPPAGYNLFDVNLHGELAVADQLVRMQFGVHNLFNKRYRDYLSRFRYFTDNPGRNVTFSLSVPFGQPMEE